MKFDFDRIIDRGSTPSYKCNREFLAKIFGRSDLYPLWIADMDFEISQNIKDALIQKTDFGVFGYEFKTESQIHSIIDWCSKYHKWSINPENMTFTTSVLTGIAIAVNQLIDEGDGVIIQPPVYKPFSKIVSNSSRTIIENPLRFEHGSYTIDLEDLEDNLYT